LIRHSFHMKPSCTLFPIPYISTSSSDRLRLLVLTGEEPSAPAESRWWIGKDEEGVEFSRIVAGGDTRAWLLLHQYQSAVEQSAHTCHWDVYRVVLAADRHVHLEPPWHHL